MENCRTRNVDTIAFFVMKLLKKVRELYSSMLMNNNCSEQLLHIALLFLSEKQIK